jgi:hypothetical protein
MAGCGESTKFVKAYLTLLIQLLLASLVTD